MRANSRLREEKFRFIARIMLDLLLLAFYKLMCPNEGDTEICLRTAADASHATVFSL